MARLVVLGSPTPAVVALHALLGAGHDVVLAVSQPDRRRGRGGSVAPSPLKQAALDAGIPVTERLDDVATAPVDLGVVVAYGRIVPRRVLDAVDLLNVHFSLLPRWRGAAPVERAILAGDRDTGVCIMRLEEQLDTGPVLARAGTAIGPEETAPALTARLADLGARLLVDVLAGGVERLPAGEPQQGEPTYAAKIEPDELVVDWERPPEDVERLVRLGRAWTTFRGRRLRLLAVRVMPGGPSPTTAAGAGTAGEASSPGTFLAPRVVAAGRGGDVGAVELLEVHAEGSRPTDAAAWANGAHPTVGERLGDRGAGRAGLGPSPGPEAPGAGL